MNGENELEIKAYGCSGPGEAFTTVRSPNTNSQLVISQSGKVSERRILRPGDGAQMSPHVPTIVTRQYEGTKKIDNGYWEVHDLAKLLDGVYGGQIRDFMDRQEESYRKMEATNAEFRARVQREIGLAKEAGMTLEEYRAIPEF